MTSERISALLVDDHSLFRKEVRHLIEAQVDVLAEACDGEDAVLQHRMRQPQITLMDLQMPRLGGIEAIARIRKESPDARFVVLTSSASEKHIRGAVAAGAQAYVLKHAARNSLLDAIRAVHAGGRWFDAAIAQYLPAQAVRSSPETSNFILRLLRRRNKP